MPTYEYVCEKCGHRFEKFQSISAEPLAICPEDLCARKRWGKGKVKRAISGGAGLIFKGSGFYITDYRSENYKASAKKESGAGESKSGGEGKPSSESKSSGETKAAAPKAEAKTAKSKSAG